MFQSTLSTAQGRRRLLWLAAAALIVLLAAGGAGAWYLVRAHQPIQATTVRFNLKDRQTEVPLKQALVVTASRPIAPGAFAAAFRIQPAATGTLDVNRKHTTFSWTPSQQWAELTEYTVSLAATRDASGNRVKPASWRFTTTIVPRVSAVATLAGAPVADGQELPLGTGLQVAFNVAMDPASVPLTAAGAPVQPAWAADSRSFRLDPSSIHPGPLPLAIGPGGKDASGRPLAPWKFGAVVLFKPVIHTQPLSAPALVQVPNDPFARPQVGLQAANVVFESLSEGNITRFSALYTNAPDNIGPVRSARLISLKLTRHYHSMMFASGDSNGTNARLLADPVPYLFDLTPGWFYRTHDRAPPNNLFIDAPTLLKAEASRGVPAAGLPTGPSAFDGQPAAQVSVPIHRTAYDYDSATGTYLKTEDGGQMLDAGLRQPLRIQLVIVLHTQVTETGIVEDVNGVHGLDYNLDASGRAEFYEYGRQAAGTWSSPNRGSPFVFTLDGGGTLNLPDGLVWVDVVP